MPTTTGKPAGPGSGNFAALAAKTSPAIAAAAGRKKYGERKMSRMASQGRKQSRKAGRY